MIIIVIYKIFAPNGIQTETLGLQASVLIIHHRDHSVNSTLHYNVKEYSALLPPPFYHI